MSVRACFAVGAATMMLVGSPAYAQEDAEEAADAVIQSAEEAATQVTQAVEEQVVTGTIIQGVTTSVSPILRIDGESLMEASTLNMNEFFLVDVTPNQGTNIETENSNQSGRTRGSRGASVNLRGLGEENTLVLINSSRVIEYAIPGNDGFRSVDINAVIPRIAVRTIDTLLDGGSGIYGSDAIAGVINYIPDYNFRGVRVNVSGNADEGDWEYFDNTIGIMGGFGNDETSIVVAAERFYSEPAPLIDADASLVNFNPQPGDVEWTGADFESNSNWYPSNLVTQAGHILPDSLMLPTGDPNWVSTAASNCSTAFGGAANQYGTCLQYVGPVTGDPGTGPDPIYFSASSLCGDRTGGPGGQRGLKGDCYSSDAPVWSFVQTVDTGPANLMIDPLCGREEELGLDSIFAGETYETLTSDGGTVDSAEPYGCYEYQFPGMGAVRQQRETENENYFIALQHQFNDRFKVATEVSYATTAITDFSEYRATENAASVASGNSTISAVDKVLGVNDPLNLNGTGKTGDFVVEWDHPALMYQSDLWTQFCLTDPSAPCYNGGVNPWDPDNYDDNVNGVQPFDHAYISYAGVTSIAHDTEMFRWGGSTTYDLSDEWSVGLAGSYATHEATNLIEDVLDARFSLALDGYGGPNCGVNDSSNTTVAPGTGDCYYWNPFMSAAQVDAPDAVRNNDAVRRWFTGPSSATYKATFWTTGVNAQGVLPIELMGGPVRAAFGIDFRSDNLDVDNDSLSEVGAFAFQDGASYPDYEGTTDTWGYVADFNLPITDTLTAQIAGRFEDYKAGSATFSSFNPKLGLNWQTPWDGLTLRASYGTAFRAPTVTHLFGNEGRRSIILDLVLDTPELEAERTARNDPTWDPSGGQYIVDDVSVSISANPSLQPQESTAFSVGGTWDLTDNLRFTFGYTKIEVSDVIATLTDAETLRFPECVTGIESAVGLDDFEYLYYVINEDAPEGTCFETDESGRVVHFNRSYYNTGDESNESLDLSLNYSLMTDFGELSIAPATSIQLASTRSSFSTGFVEVDVAGVNAGMAVATGGPEYRLNLPVTWRYGNHSATVTGRWVKGLDRGQVRLDGDGNFVSYTVVDDVNAPDWIAADFRYSYRFNDALTLGLTVSNLTNSQPDAAGASLPNDLRRYGLQLNYQMGE